MDEEVDPSVLDMVDLVGRGVRVRPQETLAVDLDEANPQEPVRISPATCGSPLGAVPGRRGLSDEKQVAELAVHEVVRFTKSLYLLRSFVYIEFGGAPEEALEPGDTNEGHAKCPPSAIHAWGVSSQNYPCGRPASIGRLTNAGLAVRRALSRPGPMKTSGARSSSSWRRDAKVNPNEVGVAIKNGWSLWTDGWTASARSGPSGRHCAFAVLAPWWN